MDDDVITMKAAAAILNVSWQRVQQLVCGSTSFRHQEEWLRVGSGDEQAKAKLRCVESDEVAVAFGPPA